MKEQNNVNHPKHYQGKHECIDEMIAMFGVEAIHRVVERTKDNNGWIPCSELPEENGMYLCTVFHADDYVVWIMRFNDGEFLKPDDVEDWNYELLAWMPIAPYQPKGE